MLRVDETTVARRLGRLQRDLGFALFDAVDGARRPTAKCRELLSHVESMHRHAGAIAALDDESNGPVGHYRIAATDSVSAAILAPNLPAFLAEHRGLTVHVLASTANVNFSRWEADLAVRLSKPDRGDFLISKLADLRFYLFEPKRPARGKTSRWSAPIPRISRTRPRCGSRNRAAGLGRVRCKTKNLLVMQSLVRTGACCAVLPEFMSGELLNDDRLKATRLTETRGAWLLMQPHLKDDHGTRALIDWLRECFMAVRRASAS